MTAPVVVAVVFGLANLALAAWAWFRAGRAAQLAERADLRANAAESRAEEAHVLLKDRTATEKERHEAEIRAPAIAEKWTIQVAAERNRLNRKDNTFSLKVEVPNLAHRLALQLVRNQKARLHIFMVAEAPDKDFATIIAYTTSAIIRLRLDKQT